MKGTPREPLAAWEKTAPTTLSSCLMKEAVLGWTLDGIWKPLKPKVELDIQLVNVPLDLHPGRAADGHLDLQLANLFHALAEQNTVGGYQYIPDPYKPLHINP